MDMNENSQLGESKEQINYAYSDDSPAGTLDSRASQHTSPGASVTFEDPSPQASQRASVDGQPENISILRPSSNAGEWRTESTLVAADDPNQCMPVVTEKEMTVEGIGDINQQQHQYEEEEEEEEQRDDQDSPQDNPEQDNASDSGARGFVAPSEGTEGTGDALDAEGLNESDPGASGGLTASAESTESNGETPASEGYSADAATNGYMAAPGVHGNTDDIEEAAVLDAQPAASGYTATMESNRSTDDTEPVASAEAKNVEVYAPGPNPTVYVTEAGESQVDETDIPAYTSEQEPVPMRSKQVHYGYSELNDAKENPEVVLGVPDGAVRYSSAPTASVRTTVVTVDGSPPLPKKPNDYTELSCFACLLNLCCGIIALNFSLKSRKAYDEGDVKAAKKHGRCACFCSMVSLLALVLLIVLLCWHFIVGFN